MKMKDRPQDIQDAYKNAVDNAVKRSMAVFICDNPDVSDDDLSIYEEGIRSIESWGQEIVECASNERAREWYRIPQEHESQAHV
jgi:hypothetical protein